MSLSTEFPTHLASIPYTDPATPLQTLDIWLPRPQSEIDENTLWIIYIHGGAWRDPLQSSDTILPTLAKLASTSSSSSSHGSNTKLPPIASINYRLSPYPSHPTHPSDPDDASRNVRHPSHIQDVQSALEYLRRNYGMRKWIGVGHSCGGTLLLQVVGEGMGRGRYVGDIGEGGEAGQGNIRREGEEEVKGPQALILLEAIYSLPLFLHNHRPEVSGDAIARIYRDIVTGAFGTDERVWEEASPVAGDYSGKKGGVEALRYIALAYSPEDELVEAEQRDVMLARLKDCGWEEGELGDSGRVVEIRDISGSHDSMWEEGGVIAEEIIRVLDALRSRTDTD